MALHLAAKQDHRSLVVLVEMWSAVGSPTPAARLAVARSYMELRLLDRAWVCLEDLVDSDDAPLDALALTGRMLLLRGWPNQARKVLQRALELAPQDEALQEMWEQSADVGTRPDENALEGDEVPVADLMRGAEHAMAEGSYQRARGLLERIRGREPGHRRAADLLWALEGDFSRDLPLDALCEELGPDFEILSDIGEEVEHTESADIDGLPLQLDREEDGGFPLLFRNLEPHADPAEPAGGAEVTAVASMSGLSELSLPTDLAEHTDPHGDDTEIMRIVRKKPDLGSAAGEASGASFNLADYRREMGIEVPAIDTDYTVEVEDEDESVVIVTRRDEELSTRDQATEIGGILLDTRTENEASLKQGTLEEVHWAAPPSQAPTVSVDTRPREEAAPANGENSPPPTQRPSEPKKKPKASRPDAAQVALAWPWWMAALAVLLASGVVVFAVLALVAAL